MKYVLLLSILGLSQSIVIADEASDGMLASRITNNEKRVNWHLSDGTEFRDVKVTKTTGGNWVEIAYTLRVRRVPAPRGEADPQAPKEPSAPRLRCWINVTHVARIVPVEDRRIPSEEGVQPRE